MQDQHGACCRDAASSGAEHATEYFRLLYVQANENLHAAGETRYPRECRAAGLRPADCVRTGSHFFHYANVISIFVSVRHIERQGYEPLR